MRMHMHSYTDAHKDELQGPFCTVHACKEFKGLWAQRNTVGTTQHFATHVNVEVALVHFHEARDCPSMRSGPDRHVSECFL